MKSIYNDPNIKNYCSKVYQSDHFWTINDEMAFIIGDIMSHSSTHYTLERN